MKIRILLLNLLVGLCGCMVGPDYRQPHPLMPETYCENRKVETCMTEEDLAHWWTVFNDPFLNELLAESLVGNFDLLIALENIAQARAIYWMQATALLPEIDSDLQITRSRTSQNLIQNSSFSLMPFQNFYQAGLDVIWQIDLFGGLRRAAKAACDIVQATEEDARGVRLVMLSEVATTYTNICALQQMNQLAAQIIHLDENLLHLATTQFDAGLAGQQQVEQAIATLEVDTAALLVIQTQLKQTIYSLAILLGRPPETFIEQFTCSRPIPDGHGRVPCGLPSDLLRRRPDIRGAERRLAASTEQIGVAVASLFPQISLTGSTASYSSNPLQGANIGFASSSFKKWFNASSLVWGIGGLVTQPLLDFGKRLAAVDEQISIEHQSLFNYEKTVIAALQEVEGSLVAYFNEDERMQSLIREAEANQSSFDLVFDRYQAGLTNFSEVLTTEEVLLNSLTNLITSRQAVTNNLINLYKALGGGWECSYMP